MFNAVAVIMYFVIAIFYGWWASKVVAYSAATQYWGQRLANTRVVLQSLYDDPDLNGTVKKANLFGFQKLITNKVQRVKTQIRFGGNIPFFLLGVVLFEWYVPILGVIVVLNVKYYFLNRSADANSTELLTVIIEDLKKELITRRTKSKVSPIEIKEREFFIHQLELTMRVNHETENSSVYRYKEIGDLRNRKGTLSLKRD